MAAVLRYPFEAITSNTDYLQLTIKQYTNEPPSDPSYGNITNARDVGTSASAGNPNPTQIVDNGIILLPMPSNIVDGTTVGYGPDTLDSISKAAMELGTGAVEATSDVFANLSGKKTDDGTPGTITDGGVGGDGTVTSGSSAAGGRGGDGGDVVATAQVGGSGNAGDRTSNGGGAGADGAAMRKASSVNVVTVNTTGLWNDDAIGTTVGSTGGSGVQ